MSGASGDTPVGGQAVMEGVMLRRGEVYALALRMPDGSIATERRPWISLGHSPFLKKPFVRGFPILMETLINGIKALNRSALESAAENGEEIQGGRLFLTLLLALLLAVGLFVIAPHLLSLGMQALQFSGGVESLGFHLWDGLFKFAIFFAYIVAISFVPEIRRVFRYHGAEHKVIRALEAGGEISAETAARFSRLHPRCGTTFLLFVLALSILLHAALVPLLLLFPLSENAVLRHAAIIVFKLFLMIPVSSLAYELIRRAATLEDSLLGYALRAPGMLLQMLTTYEPDKEQLEVAVAALAEVMGDAAPEELYAPQYRRMEQN